MSDLDWAKSQITGLLLLGKANKLKKKGKNKRKRKTRRIKKRKSWHKIRSQKKKLQNYSILKKKYKAAEMNFAKN